MLGAVMGDLCGSPWEGGSCRSDEFELFHPSADITDDTVCTIAIAQALLDSLPIDETLRRWCRAYPGMGYGSMFNSWVYRPSQGPYESWGNGGAMRCSPCAWLASSLAEAQALAIRTAEVTHNHPEGLRGARAIASAVWLALEGADADTIRRLIQQDVGYELGRSTQAWAALNPSGSDAQDTVPIALDSSLDASSVGDAIRRAAYIGGDVDTTSSMAAAIAEARFGLTWDEVTFTLAKVPDEMHPIIHAVYERRGRPMVANPRAGKRPADPGDPPQRGRRPLIARARRWLSRSAKS